MERATEFFLSIETFATRSLVALVHLSNLIHTHSLSIYRARIQPFLSRSSPLCVKHTQSEIVSIWRNLTLVADLHFVFFFFFIAASNLNFIAFTVVNLEATETTAMNVNGEQQSKKNELCSGTKKFLCAALFCFQLYLINNTSC